MGNKIELASIVTDLEFLRQVSKKTSIKEVEKKKVVEIIKEAMKTAWCNGYGLAAIQVGIPIRAAWFWYFNSKKERVEHLLINPVIIEKSEPIVIPGEGCLSIPNKMFSVQRYNQIVFENNGQRFSVEGKEAQIVQHEIDHMSGILVCDRVYKASQGRNELCACGSGKKYKKCCGR